MKLRVGNENITGAGSWGYELSKFLILFHLHNISHSKSLVCFVIFLGNYKQTCNFFSKTSANKSQMIWKISRQCHLWSILKQQGYEKAALDFAAEISTEKQAIAFQIVTYEEKWFWLSGFLYWAHFKWRHFFKLWHTCKPLTPFRRTPLHRPLLYKIVCAQNYQYFARQSLLNNFSHWELVTCKNRKGTWTTLNWAQSELFWSQNNAFWFV